MAQEVLEKCPVPRLPRQFSSTWKVFGLRAAKSHTKTQTHLSESSILRSLAPFLPAFP